MGWESELFNAYSVAAIILSIMVIIFIIFLLKDRKRY